jgi:PTS system mannitol-specific IIA component
MTKILSTDKVKLGATVSNKEEAIRLAGQLLVDAGHVDATYVEKMLEREAALSTFMGNGIAIPHGTNDSKALVKSTGLSVVQIPDGVDFGDGNVAKLLIGIAASGNEHVEILTNIAMIISEDENVDQILNAASADDIIEIFEKGM